MAELLVSFGVRGPPNPFQNVTFARSVFTNETGVAAISFNVSYISEISFGEWTVVGNTEMGLTDTLKFKFGWIVEIVSLKTMSENYTEQEVFMREANIGIEVGVRNIAMTERTATITVAIFDSLNINVNAAELNDFVVPPNETLTHTYFFLYIPKSAHVGPAIVYAGAYNAPPEIDGVPYSPEVSKQISIVAKEYFLTVRTEPSGITSIAGEGWYKENINVNLTASASVLISTVVQYRFVYWDIDGVLQGSEVNSISVLMDNDHTATAHYIQVTIYTLTILTTEGGITDPPPGLYYYEGGSTVQVTALPNASYFLNHWELDGLHVGSVNPYTVVMNKNQTLKAVFSLTPAALFLSYWPYWLLLPLLISVFLLIALLYRRRRRKRGETFYSGWTAWYYYYDDLRNKLRKA
jgi:hypothetical protein